MKLYNIIEHIEKFSPKGVAEEWDNVGLQIGDPNADIKKAVVCLDVTSGLVDFAVENNIDLIVSHHPFIMTAMKTIDLSKNPDIKKAIKNEIAIYSMHTNFDFCYGGLNDILCEMLGLTGYIPEKENDLRIGKLADPVLLSDFISNVKERFDVKNIQYCGELSKKIQTVAVCSGGGGAYIENAQIADAYLTGEVKYHEFDKANKLGIAVVAAGHFETEDIGLFKIRDLLKQINIEVLETEVHKGFSKYI
jgi:dinuclear metal center YbgI/SA1388 family protein